MPIRRSSEALHFCYRRTGLEGRAIFKVAAENAATSPAAGRPKRNPRTFSNYLLARAWERAIRKGNRSIATAATPKPKHFQLAVRCQPKRSDRENYEVAAARIQEVLGNQSARATGLALARGSCGSHCGATMKSKDLIACNSALSTLGKQNPQVDHLIGLKNCPEGNRCEEGSEYQRQALGHWIPITRSPSFSVGLQDLLRWATMTWRGKTRPTSSREEDEYKRFVAKPDVTLYDRLKNFSVSRRGRTFQCGW